MNCPRDGTRLGVAKVDGCSLEKCPHCEGLWIEHEEMEKILTLGWHEAEKCVHIVAPDNDESSPHRPGYKRCPKCLEGRLQSITYTLTRPIRIDRCDTCLGYWVDHSELDAILMDKVRIDALETEAFAGRSKSADGTECH